MRFIFSLVFLGLAVVSSTTANAQNTVPFEAIRFVSSPDAPPFLEDGISIADAATYRLRVTDFGTAGTSVAPADSLRLIGVTSGGEVSFDVNSVGDTTVALPAGELAIALFVEIAETAEAASVGFELRRDGATDDVYRTVQPFSAAIQPSNPSSQTERFAVTETGMYTLALTDLEFPDPADDVQAIVLDQPAGSVLGVLNTTAPLELMLEAGVAPEITTLLTRSSDNARSSASLVATNDAGVIVYESVLDAGDFSEVVDVTIEDLTIGSTTSVRLTDFGFPQAIEGLRGLLRNAGEAVIVVPGVPANFSPLETAATLRVSAEPGTTGATGLRVDEGDRTLIDTLVTLEPQSEFNIAAVVESTFEVAQPGVITVEVRDFASPAAFDRIVAAVLFDGQIVAELEAAGVVSFTADAGTYAITVVGSFDTPQIGNLGVSVIDAQGVPLAEFSESAGGAVNIEEIQIDETQRIRVSANDLSVPAALGELSLTLTRGADILGMILGGGTFDTTLEPGTYRVNVVGNPGLVPGYGAYRIAVSEVPDAPLISFSASATSVATGGDVTLNWDAENADACTASGAWSGDRETSGSETVTNVTSNSEFRIECAGAGGTSSASVSVTVLAASSVSGGGGATGIWPLCVLFTILFGARIARRYRHKPGDYAAAG